MARRSSERASSPVRQRTTSRPRARTRHGQVVADKPESEISTRRDPVPGEASAGRENESHGINAQPEAVPVSIPCKLRAEPRRRAHFGRRHRGRTGKPRSACAGAEQPLLADALRNRTASCAPSREAIQPRSTADTVRGLPVPSLTFGLRQHLRESTPKPLQHSFGRLCFRRCFRLVRHLAVRSRRS